MAHVAIVWEEIRLTVDDLARVCGVGREWIVERVEAGLLLADAGRDSETWRFGGGGLFRAKRLHEIERFFDANPEVAALVADLEEETARLRAVIKRSGIGKFA